MFKFYLNNTLVSDPINWAEFTETIERDDTIKGLLPKYDVKLQFNAGGYDYLYSLYRSSGYCNLVDLKIDYKCGDNYETILNGYIFISDCKFNLNRCIVECEVQDDNYGARIYNNKTIKAYLGGVKSKNDTTITPCTYSNIKLFTPSTGALGVTTRKAYSVKDAFRFLVDFMTDGIIGFESNYLDSIDDLKYLKLLTGEEIRTGAQSNSPYLSFSDLFNEINKRYPIGFTIITNSSGQKVIKIEDADYFYNSTSSIRINNIDNLYESFNNELLYSVVKFGGVALDYNGTTRHFPQSRFFNFINEEYHFKTECNIDKPLDLTTAFISDSNIIEEVYVTNTSDDTYDDDIFLIESTISLTAKTYNDPITLGLPYFYNEKLLNNKIAERYNLESAIAVYLGNNDDTFAAYYDGFYTDLLAAFSNPSYVGKVVDPSYPLEAQLIFPVDYPNVNELCFSAFDTNDNYTPATGKYTSPFNGIYGFRVYVNIDILAGQTTNATLGIRFKVFDSSDNLQNTYQPTSSSFANSTNLGNVKYEAIFDSTFYVPQGYYVKVYFYMEALFWSLDTVVLNGSASVCTKASFFSTLFVSNGGGTYTPSDPEDYFVSKLEFNAPISYDNYKTLKLDLSKNLIINHDGKTNKNAWIRKFVRNFSTGTSEIELISNINNSR